VNYAFESKLEIGLAFHHWDELLSSVLGGDPALFRLLEKINYLVCYHTIDQTRFGKEELAKEFEAFL